MANKTKTGKTYVPTVKIDQLKRFAKRMVACGSNRKAALAEVRRFERSLKGSTVKGTWKFYLRQYAQFLIDGKPRFSIFKAKGNIKLPFVSFSTLPDSTCPGAGDCLKWCYSFTGWRYPAAFLGQLQNTYLILHSKATIAREFAKIKQDRTIRLYVDGDFDSVATIAFWARLLMSRQDLSAYGYSKSWDELLQYDAQGLPWPPNYVLNVSSGSRHDDATKQAVMSLDCTRDQFAAVEIDMSGVARGTKRYSDPLYHQRVRDAYQAEHGKKAISCPGQCGSCGVSQHMCGDSKVIVPIAIGIHRGNS